jgi:hypothetical protein
MCSLFYETFSSTFTPAQVSSKIFPVTTIAPAAAKLFLLLPMENNCFA